MTLSQIDYLSSLPPELLEYIFDLAASFPNVSIVSPSKRLLPHHDRALYRSVKIGSDERLDMFSEALDSQPHKALLVKNISFVVGLRCHKPTPSAVFEILSKLPSLIDLKPPGNWPQLVEVLERGVDRARYLKNLETCRLVGTELSSALVKGLSLLPKLRRVEVSSMSRDLQASLITANQVTEVVLDLGYKPEAAHPDPSSFLRLFPSAKIVSLITMPCTRSHHDWIRRILPPLAPFLRSLHLTHNGNPPRDLPPIDYSNFTNLQELHVETPSLFDPSYLLKDPLAFVHLVDLTLIVNQLHPDILQLFRGPQRLRHLQHLTLEYRPCIQGLKVDMEKAEADVETDEWDEEGKGWALVSECFGMEDMVGDGWRLPFVDYGTVGGFSSKDQGGIYNGLRLAAEMEKVAKEAGIVIDSGPFARLEDITELFWLQVLEYYSRGVADAYLRGDSTLMKDARRLANLHGVPLPPLLVDLDRKLPLLKLEYFKVDMSQASRSIFTRHWWTYNLRYREEGESDSSVGDVSDEDGSEDGSEGDGSDGDSSEGDRSEGDSSEGDGLTDSFEQGPGIEM